MVAACGASWDPSPIAGLAVALVALLGARSSLGRDNNDAEAPPPPPVWDLYARAGSTAVLVIAITTAAAALGPGVSGVLTPFPIATSVIAAFTLAHSGSAATVRMLRGFVAALPGFAAFFFVVAIALG